MIGTNAVIVSWPPDPDLMPYHLVPNLLAFALDPLDEFLAVPIFVNSLDAVTEFLCSFLP